MKTFIVWNEDKASAATYEELKQREEGTGYSYSSIIETNNIVQFVHAVQNEFDGDLLYHETSDPSHINTLINWIKSKIKV